MARKRKVKEPTLRERITQDVHKLLTCNVITPRQVYDLMLLGSRMYRQGVGIPEFHVVDAILEAFEKQNRHYLNPYQSAQLRDADAPELVDWESLDV